jgi:hypothetical protein
MTRYIWVALILGLLMGPLAAPAPGHGGWGVPTTAAYYPVFFAPVPAVSVVAYPVVPAVECVPVPAFALPVAPSPYATPTPAPPSVTVEPPTAPGAKQAPKITESHLQSTLYNARPTNIAGQAGHRVGFWNLTGRDVIVTVDGQAHQLPPGRSVTLHLARQFAWHLDGRPVQNEQIPPDGSTLEIVLRR